MQFKLSSILLFATTALCQTNCPASSVFRVHSLLKNATDISSPGSSFGYLKTAFWYSSRYHAILDPEDSWTTTSAYVTDIYNNSDSRLLFPTNDFTHAIGFVLNPLSTETSTEFAEMNGNSVGTEGVYYDDAGKIQWEVEPGCTVQWHGCPNQELQDYGNVTYLGYRKYDVATPKGCFDVDLVMEYMDGWNTPTGLPPKCWPITN